MNCSKCSAEFTPSAYQIRAQNKQCLKCRSEYNKEHRKRRKAEGRPIPPPKKSSWTSEHRKAWSKEYSSREDVKEKKRLGAAAIRRDPSYRSRIRARALVNHALDHGRMTKLPCAVCGSESSEGHHEDYGNPLEVVWLCRPHHRQLHLGRISLPAILHTELEKELGR